jgi:predicted  nucleic acid-binding Zn-ribbon protein
LINPSFHLYQLQKIDLKVDALKVRLADITAIRKNNSSTQKAEEKRNLSKTYFELSLSSLKITEDKVRAKKLKSEQSESSLYSGTIKNPKELQDLQSEIQSLKSAISSFEETQLSQMIDLEEKEKTLHVADSELQAAVKEFESVLSTLVMEESKISIDLERLQQERNAVIEQITPVNYQVYLDLRKTKKGIAITLIEDGSCSTCGTTLTPSDCQNAKSPLNMVNCQSCGRILYAG